MLVITRDFNREIAAFVTTGRFDEASFYRNYIRMHSSYGGPRRNWCFGLSEGWEKEGRGGENKERNDFICRRDVKASERRRSVQDSRNSRDLKVLGKCASMKSSRANIGSFALISCSALVSEIDVVRSTTCFVSIFFSYLRRVCFGHVCLCL